MQTARTFIDGTFGAGGYTRAILDAADCSVLAHRSRSERHSRLAQRLKREFGAA